MSSASRSLLRDEEDSTELDGTSPSQAPSRMPRAILLATVTLVLVALGASHAVRPTALSAVGGSTSSSAASRTEPLTQVDARASRHHPHHRTANFHGPQFGLRMDRAAHQRQLPGRPGEKEQEGSAPEKAPSSQRQRTAEELRSQNIRESQEDPTSMFDMSTP